MRFQFLKLELYIGDTRLPQSFDVIVVRVLLNGWLPHDNQYVECQDARCGGDARIDPAFNTIRASIGISASRSGTRGIGAPVVSWTFMWTSNIGSRPVCRRARTGDEHSLPAPIRHNRNREFHRYANRPASWQVLLLDPPILCYRSTCLGTRIQQIRSVQTALAGYFHTPGDVCVVIVTH